MSRSVVVVLLVLTVSPAGCRRWRRAARPGTTAAATLPAPSQARVEPGRAGMVQIAAGEFRVGSMPGDRERDPNAEMDLQAMPIGAFEIDVEPHAETSVTLADARRVCEGQAKRLCTEAEWERACKGPEFLDRAPAEADRPNGFGVRSMGVALLEWTSSVWGRDPDDAARGVAVRGATRGAPADKHRCGHREPVAPDASAAYIGFRCCAGEDTQAIYAMPRLPRGDIFHATRMEQSVFRAIVAEVPELAPVADGIMLFNQNDVAAVLARGGTSAEEHPEFHFTGWPIEWVPTRGEDLLVFAAHNVRHDVIAALYVMPDGRHKAAAVMILADDPVPLALWFGDSHGDSRRRIYWSPAYGQGEGGSVVYTEDGRVAITHR